MLQVYTLFHLNLSYSSIEEKQRDEVILKCYWPLLQAIKDLGFPCAIEATAYTLEEISRLDTSFINELSELIKNGQVELVASGYVQAIAPLLPAGFNRANLLLGNQVYKNLLGIVPKIVLANEQAYSNGLVSLYCEAGFDAVIMEWNNAAAVHPEWNAEWRYHPQKAVDDHANSIPIIWSDSISFQQFQRYVHADIDRDSYENYIESHKGDLTRNLCLYANDAEIFDFRPGRYHTEADLVESEWVKIRQLFTDLKNNSDIQIVLPSQLLSDSSIDAFNPVKLGNAELPVPVKKQGKYNLLRWANSGRNDLEINTRCRRIFEAIKDVPLEDPVWKTLCRLWASDFRTHITSLRWEVYIKELTDLEVSVLKVPVAPATISPQKINPGQVVELADGKTRVSLDTRRGLSIRECYLGETATPLFGLIPHGRFHDIRFAADWYSGHMTYEIGGHHKITDLCSGTVSQHDNQMITDISIHNFGQLSKAVVVDDDEGLVLRYQFRVNPEFDGVWRCGFITLNPACFDINTLCYATHNGGDELEAFDIGPAFDHGRPVSHLVSANTGLGATNGEIFIGDAAKKLHVRFDPGELAVIPMLSFAKVDGSYLLRLWFSLRELDDTRRFDQTQRIEYDFSFKISLIA
ncbi:MAG: glycoside hydrolase family 57 [Gammaproteobacteria bacterium]|nr:glycoside hydrolase family 57 [Gammaproteobacteria bacterium]